MPRVKVWVRLRVWIRVGVGVRVRVFRGYRLLYCRKWLPRRAILFAMRLTCRVNHGIFGWSMRLAGDIAQSRVRGRRWYERTRGHLGSLDRWLYSSLCGRRQVLDRGRGRWVSPALNFTYGFRWATCTADGVCFPHSRVSYVLHGPGVRPQGGAHTAGSTPLVRTQHYWPGKVTWGQHRVPRRTYDALTKNYRSVQHMLDMAASNVFYNAQHSVFHSHHAIQRQPCAKVL